MTVEQSMYEFSEGYKFISRQLEETKGLDTRVIKIKQKYISMFFMESFKREKGSITSLHNGLYCRYQDIWSSNSVEHISSILKMKDHTEYQLRIKLSQFMYQYERQERQKDFEKQKLKKAVILEMLTHTHNNQKSKDEQAQQSLQFSDCTSSETDNHKIEHNYINSHIDSLSQEIQMVSRPIEINGYDKKDQTASQIPYFRNKKGRGEAIKIEDNHQYLEFQGSQQLQQLNQLREVLPKMQRTQEEIFEDKQVLSQQQINGIKMDIDKKVDQTIKCKNQLKNKQCYENIIISKENKSSEKNCMGSQNRGQSYLDKYHHRIGGLPLKRILKPIHIDKTPSKQAHPKSPTQPQQHPLVAPKSPYKVNRSPSISPRSIKKSFTKQSNKKMIINIITTIFYSGQLNRNERENLLQIIQSEPSEYFVLLFKSYSRKTIKGVYTMSSQLKTLARVYGEKAPMLIHVEDISIFYRFDTVSREFRPIEACKQLSYVIHGVDLK